jgi:hypothetical protein
MLLSLGRGNSIEIKHSGGTPSESCQVG